MRKVKLLILLSVICLCFVTALAACGKKTYAATFMNGTEIYETVSVKSGERVVLPSAPTKAGYIFAGWFYENDEEYSGQALTKNITVYAHWNEIETDKFTLTVTAGLGGTVDTNGGLYAAGTDITLVATPNAGYSFAGWYNNGYKILGMGTVYSFKMPAANLSLEAKFTLDSIEKHMLTVTAEEGGALEADYDGEYASGELIPMKAVPAPGFEFAGWYDENGLVADAEAAFTLVMPAFDYEIRASFTEIVLTYVLTVIAENGGELISDPSGTYPAGVSVTAKALAHENFEFDGWYHGNMKVSANADYSFYTLAEDYSLKARFVEIIPEPEYDLTIIIETDGEEDEAGGLVQTERDGNSVTLTATANSDYRFKGWYKDSHLVKSTAVYSFTLTSDTVLVARFETDGDVTPTSWLIYTKIDGKNEYEVKAGEPNPEDVAVVIAPTYEGLPVTRIASYAFYDSKDINKYNFIQSIVVPDSVTTILNSAFRYCSGLLSIELPSVTFIGQTSFYYCTSLVSISIPAVEVIEKNMFYGCSKLLSIEIPEGVTAIEEYTFYFCVKLTSVVLPSTIITIGEHAFQNCTALVNITLPKNLEAIGSEAFSLCESIKSIIIPHKITEIKFNVFYGCKNMSTLILPSGLTAIRSLAFTNCSSLTSITIPSTVTAIEDYTFLGCNSLTIYTSYVGAPAGWTGWNPSSRPVLWGSVINTDGIYPYVVSYTKTSNISGSLNAPLRLGYTFAGWFNNPECTGTPVSASAIATAANRTYYAGWGEAEAQSVIIKTIECYCVIKKD